MHNLWRNLLHHSSVVILEEERLWYCANLLQRHKTCLHIAWAQIHKRRECGESRTPSLHNPFLGSSAHSFFIRVGSLAPFSLANLIPTRNCWSCKFSSLILVFYSNACAANTLDLRRQRTLTAALLINVVNEISRRRHSPRRGEKSPVVKMSHRDAKTTTQRTCWLIYTDFNIFIYRWTIDILSVGVFKTMQYFFKVIFFFVTISIQT